MHHGMPNAVSLVLLFILYQVECLVDRPVVKMTAYLKAQTVLHGAARERHGLLYGTPRVEH